MEPTKDSINEGIVTVVAPKPSSESKDIYNIKSGNHEVLILEVCKNQSTKESVIDCLSVQQINLVENNHSNTIIGFSAIGLTIVALLIGMLISFKTNSRRN